MDALIALLTLTSLEIVLGLDNIIFLTILVSKLPASERELARKLGLGFALVMRLGLLFSITWVMGLTAPIFELFGHSFSGRDLILLVGGMFLIAKATWEIHEKLEAGIDDSDGHSSHKGQGSKAGFVSILTQITLMDLIFSLDSVITAVGMAQEIWVMVVAMILAMAVMLFSAKSIGELVSRHPTIKILALAFLILIGSTLVMEGMGAHVNKGYIYFAMAFSLGIEILNIRFRSSGKPVKLRTSGPESS